MVQATSSPEFLATLLVSALAAATVLPVVLPEVRRWLRLFRSSRRRAVLSAVLLLTFVYIGGSLDKRGPLELSGPENRVEETRSSLRSGDSSCLPPWYIDLGYPTTDTDGDGIPDYWERRTRTDRFVADATADPDGDGVDNAEEFWYECDPLVKDTDGDGLSDREEIDGWTADLSGFDPLAQCDYPVDETDATAWEGQPGRIVPFAGVNSNGLPLNVGYSEESADNVDVRLTIDSTRYAELSWVDDGQTKRLLLPPCTNMVLRLRVSATETSSVSLLAAPGATGVWKAALRAEWDARRELTTERTRIQSENGWLVDLSDTETVFAGVLPGTFEEENEQTRANAPRLLRSVQNAPPLSITMVPRRAFGVEMSPTCRLHGPFPTFTGMFTNAVPPFFWTVNGQSFTTDIPELNVLFLAEEYQVGCFDSGAYSMIPHGTNGVFHVGQCQTGPETNFVGACWTSTHNPTNAADHLPYVEEVAVSYAPLCPVYTNTVVHAGWTHDTAILWLRNLVRILTGDPWDDETDHCISLLYDEGATIDLFDYLADVCIPYRDNFTFRVNGCSLSGHTMNMSDYATIDNLKPEVLHVSFSMGESRELDRFWIVIYADSLETNFTSWCATYSSTAWTSVLPPVPSCISLSTNSQGIVSVGTERTYPGWKTPGKISSYLHHDATYEMRSEPVGIHGHQATYREDGTLIRTSISAGTADYNHPLSFGMIWGRGVIEQHYVNDVIPFLRAISLDGNPGIYNDRYIPKTITRPCIRQGDNLENYLMRRPTLPTGTIP